MSQVYLNGLRVPKWAQCHKLIQMSLPMALYRARKLLETPRVWKVLEKPGGIHTILHYDGRYERSLGLSREFQKSLVYTCIQACTQNDVGHSRIVLSCKEPSKVPESSIGAYKQVRASFGQGTKQVSIQALVKDSLSQLPFFKGLPTKLLKLLSRECLSRAS